jgi:beta-lactamase superfamily II metal-dependent hydrolase
MGLYPTLKANVVVVPHHGSKTTLDDRFLQQFGAEVLICSCGRQDFERGRVIASPAGRASLPTDLYLTARDGAVSVCIHSDGVVKAAALRVSQSESRTQEGD